MAGYQIPGTLCLTRSERIDGGTLRVSNSPPPGFVGDSTNDQALFESTIKALEADVAYLGTQFVLDSEVRLAYARQIKAMADDLRMKASSGSMSWKQAAVDAQETRNAIMEVMRGRSSPVGRAEAEAIKKHGRTLNELIANKTHELFGNSADFDRLSQSQKNQVYAEIVKSAGKSDPEVNGRLLRLSRYGRGLLFLSIAISVYTVANSNDKVATAKHEVKVTGAGIAGGFAGGALAGLACGPGAPVCVTVGAFVGGALAAFGADYFW
jgi:hypothetical protein